jgi:hypothetical protein
MVWIRAQVRREVEAEGELGTLPMVVTRLVRQPELEGQRVVVQAAQAATRVVGVSGPVHPRAAVAVVAGARGQAVQAPLVVSK